MSIWRLAAKEIRYRQVNSLLAVLSVAAAVGTVSAVLSAGVARRVGAERQLARQEAGLGARLAGIREDVRRAMLNLGFTLVVLPKDQNLADWHAEDYAAQTMPEAYADRLAAADIPSAAHFASRLTRRLKWPETGWTILVAGVDDRVRRPSADVPELKPPSVPAGRVALGCEIHRGLKLSVGERIRIAGREFVVARCDPETGSAEDITAVVSLRDAQEMFGLAGRINEIRAVEGGGGIERVRREIAGAVPDVQVIARRSESTAKAEAQLRAAEQAAGAVAESRAGQAGLRAGIGREGLVLAGLAAGLGVLWVVLLALDNARRRGWEAALLGALGVRRAQVVGLFVARWLVLGAAGAALGLAAGWWCGQAGADAGAAVGPGWAGIAAAVLLGVALTSAAAAAATFRMIRLEPGRLMQAE